MGSIFQDIKIALDGKEYVVPSDKVMGLLAAIERHITLTEISNASMARGTIPVSSLCSAYAAALNYAGATVTAEEIYKRSFAKGGQEMIMRATIAIMHMLIPPDTALTGASMASKAVAKSRKVDAGNE